jgi:hypothetical protein
MRIFISYAKKDTAGMARHLRDALAALPGVEAWMDESIDGGADWAQSIQDEVDRCDWMIVEKPDRSRAIL